MSYPIVTPNAYRIGVTFGAPIDVSLGGTIQANDLRDASLVFNLNGDCAFAWVYGPNVALLRVKSNGQFCWYTNCNFATFRNVLTLSNISIVNFIGSNAVQVFSNIGATRYGTVIPFPSNFVNGGWIGFSAIPFKTPPCPCGGAGVAQTTYFDAKNNLMLTEYVKSFAQDYQLWCAVYSPGQNGPVIVNQGYMGFFDNASNPVLNSAGYNKVAGGISYSPNVDATFAYDQNGNFLGKHISFTDAPGAYVAIGAANISNGSLDCSGDSTNYPQVNLLLQSVLNMNAATFTGYKFHTSPNALISGATDLPSIMCLCNTLGAVNLFNGQNFVELFYGNPGGSVQYGSGFFNGNVVTVVSKYNGAAPPYNVAVYIGAPNTALPNLQPPPVIQSQQSSQLLNWHRPISTRGLFKT